MANKTGVRYNKGGALARKKMLSIDFSAMGDIIEKLDNLGMNLEQIVSKTMEEEGREVQQDTLKAIADSNLPARGKYSTGDTEASVIHDVAVTNFGSVLEMKLGFDKTKPGAGGFLITGTPKMQPVRALADIYSAKRYERNLTNKIKKSLQNELDRLGG